MNNKRLISKIWKINKDVLQSYLNNSNSIADVLIKLGYTSTAVGNHRTLHKRITYDNLSLEVLNINREISRKTQLTKIRSDRKIPTDQIFCVNSRMSRGGIKNKIIVERIIPYECSTPECKNGGIHCGKPLLLQLDHINGVNNDNRLENLRFLCPNCHTQTSTFGNKGRKKPRPLKVSEINPNYKKLPKPNSRKVVRPSKDELFKLIWELPTTKIAKQLGVTDVAVAKWCKCYGINKPPRGYWRKIESSL